MNELCCFQLRPLHLLCLLGPPTCPSDLTPPPLPLSCAQEADCRYPSADTLAPRFLLELPGGNSAGNQSEREKILGQGIYSPRPSWPGHQGLAVSPHQGPKLQDPLCLWIILPPFALRASSALAPLTSGSPGLLRSLLLVSLNSACTFVQSPVWVSPASCQTSAVTMSLCGLPSALHVLVPSSP